MSNMLRITGLATGLDVDTLVQQLMRAETSRLDKVKQDRQMVEWRQELYRDLIGELNTFKSTFFDVLKSDSYMLSDKNYSSFDITTSDSNAFLTVTATTGAMAGNYSVIVDKIAEKASIVGQSEINVKEALGGFTFMAQIKASDPGANNIISFDIGDGASHSITLDAGNYSFSELASKINSKLKDANGDISGKVRAVTDGQKIRFVAIKTFDTDQTLNIADGTDSYSITIEKGSYTTDQLSSLINSKMASTKLASGSGYLSDKLKASTSADGSKVEFKKLNDSEVSVGNEDVLSSTMKITNNTVDVSATNTLEYDRKIIAGVNDTLLITVNGVQYDVTLEPTPDGSIGYGKPTGGQSSDVVLKDLVSKLNDALKTAKKHSDNSTVDLTASDEAGEKLSARLSLDGTRIQLVSNSNKTVSVSGNATSLLGFPGSFDVNMRVDDKLSTLFGDDSDFVADFTINDGSKNVRFIYDFTKDKDETTDGVTTIGAKNKTIYDLLNDISSRANVKLTYSQLTRKFTLESNATGAAQSITVKATADTDTGKFISALFGGAKLTDQGLDAQVNIVNPQGGSPITVVKPTNNFTIDGVNYNLIKPSATKEGGEDKIPTTLTLTANPQKTYDKIKAFIDKYNEVIDKINDKISERKQYSYLPLTDDQKKEMEESDIKKWEEKAKEGLLWSDSTLGNILQSMRNAFYEPVRTSYTETNSIGISLKDIGLTTSSDISERGKIVIDEAKLKDAIMNKGDKVISLFTKVSSSVPSYTRDLSGTERSNRYKEQGIFQRISDILQDNLSTFRDSRGNKGILLEKAGIKGDYTEFDNMLTDELNRQDKKINELIERLADKEQRYYLQFSRLETAMQSLNNQSSWLMQQLGLGGN